MKKIVSLLLLLTLLANMTATAAFAAQEQTFTPVTDPAAAAESTVPMYLYAEDGDGVRHYMRQVKGAAASDHGYGEKVTTTKPYSLYTTTDIAEAPVYTVVRTECEGTTEYMIQFHDAAGNKDYILYILTSGVGPNDPSKGNTHAKHHFLWNEEKQYFYQLEGSEVYVLVMKNMTATYDATSKLPKMTQNEWRITCAPVTELDTEGVYPVSLAYHSHSYTVPTQIVGDAVNHRLDCACGSQGTELVTHSYDEDRTCVCGKRESVSLQEGIYYLSGTVNGTTYYFRKTGTGESVSHTAPYSLCTTADKSAATLVDVIQEQTGKFSLAYPYGDNTARIYVYGKTGGTVNTGVNTKNAEDYHHFQWDSENQWFYQMEGNTKYVLAFKELKNNNTGNNEIRVQAVPDDPSNTIVAVKLEAHTQHSCDTWVIETPATTSTTGLKTGTCTVCGRQVQEVIPVLIPAISGRSISLQDAFSINFYVEKAAFADGVYRNPYVIFELDGKQTKVSEYSLKDECFVFAYEDITPDKMGKMVKATLYAEKQDGTEFSVTKEYSVAEYCYAALDMEQTGDAMRRLLVDTLNYGAVCQRYQNSDVAAEDLVNAALTEEQRAWGSDETIRELESCRGVEKKVEAPSASWYATSLLMGDAIQMRHYFRAEDVTDLTVQAESAGGKWILEDIQTKNGMYYVDFGGLDPAQMDEKVSFTVYRGETAVSDTLHYSIASYAKVWLEREDTRPQQAELVKAIIRYGDAAKAYVDRVYDLQADVRYLGRTYERNETQWFNWSASGFSVRFQGSGLKAKIASNAPNATNYAYLKVYVDGVEQEDILLDAKEQTVILAEGLDPEQTHTVEVRKRNSARSSTAGVVWMEVLDGQKLAPPAAKEKLIEFVGDSLTVGYSASKEAMEETKWSTKTEDGTRTYSKQVADAFDAEYMVTAISGRGIVMNNQNASAPWFKDIYPKLDLYNDPDTAYDFSLQPDVIVINLGSNDATNNDLDLDVFQAGVVSFIQLVRSNNPNAQILWAYGMRHIEGTDVKHVEVGERIQAAIAELNDPEVYYLQLDAVDTKTQLHITHPIASAYAPSGEAIIEKIAEITGW